MYKYTDPTNQVVSDGNGWSGLVTAPEVRSWIASGNTPYPADVPNPQIAIDDRLAQLRKVREGILNRLGGISGRASRAGDAGLARACDVAVQSLLDVTKGLPTDLASMDALVMTRYQSIAVSAETAAPGLGTAFVEIGL